MNFPMHEKVNKNVQNKFIFFDTYFIAISETLCIEGGEQKGNRLSKRGLEGGRKMSIVYALN
jgi:hypothetical protein